MVLAPCTFTYRLLSTYRAQTHTHTHQPRTRTRIHPYTDTRLTLKTPPPFGDKFNRVYTRILDFVLKQ